MPRLPDRIVSRVHELEAELGRVVEGGPRALDLVVPALPELLDADTAMSFSFESSGDGLRLGEHALAHLPGSLFHACDAFIGAQPVSWTNFNPAMPEPRQRNVAMAWEQLRTLVPERSIADVPINRHVLSRFGLAEHDQLRVLVCDGPALLAWIGATRPDPFGARERRTLQRLVPSILQRRRAEAMLPAPGAFRGLFEAAFDAIASPAFVVTLAGAVVESNDMGRAWLAREGRAGADELCATARRGGSARFAATRVAARGASDRLLLVLRAAVGDRMAERVALAAARWGLTPIRARILALLVEGLTTRTIAATVRLPERTVEAHLTAMYDKAQVGSRAALAAAVWR